ncbi:Uncharacterised protein [uncultured Comamonas sp.]|nr:Uncharacterised protein [uncultured Comamonas sp.]
MTYYKRHRWTPEQDRYILEHHKVENVAEMAKALGLPYYKVRTRTRAIARRALPQIAGVQAIEWAGGSYYRLPPKQTMHRGITGRLIHHSATALDDAPEDGQ